MCWLLVSASHPAYHQALPMPCVAEEAWAHAPGPCTRHVPMMVTVASRRDKEDDRELQYQEKV